MKHSAFKLTMVAPLLALAAAVPQTARASSLPGPQCHDPATNGVGAIRTARPERNKLEAIRTQQEEGLPPAQPAVVVPCIVGGIATMAAFSESATDRPDVFGSIALPVSKTPLDAKWRAASGVRLSAHSGPWAALIRALSDQGRAEQLQSVNQWVNARVSFTDDRADIWSGADATLRRASGDCEDYAIAKMKLLEAAGVAPTDMYIIIARDLVRRADHALLVVRLDRRLVVLDNSTDQLLDAEQISDYRPIFSYSANGAWVHGYTEKPVQIAAAL